MKGIPQNVSEAVRKRNPHLYGVGALEAAKPKPAEKTLDGVAKKQDRSRTSLEYRVALIARRNRICDDDNNVASFKPLRDAIARSLGVDDGDGRIKFEYSQVETNGAEGCIVSVYKVSKQT